MEAGVLADILHGQLVAGLVAGDGLVLCAVILENAVDLLHLGDGHHVAEEDGHFQHRLEDDSRPAGQGDHLAEAAHQHRRQDGEQQDSEQAAHEGRTGHQDVLGLLAQMVAHPFFKGGLFLFGVVLVAHAHLSRVHHVVVAGDEALYHRDGSPHERDLGPDAVFRGVFYLRFDGAVGLAHSAADVLRAAHHDAFHQGLTAHTGLEAFLLGFVIHKMDFSCPFFGFYLTT